MSSCTVPGGPREDHSQGDIEMVWVSTANRVPNSLHSPMQPLLIPSRNWNLHETRPYAVCSTISAEPQRSNVCRRRNSSARGSVRKSRTSLGQHR